MRCFFSWLTFSGLTLAAAVSGSYASTIDTCVQGPSGGMVVFTCSAGTPDPFNDNTAGRSDNLLTYGERFDTLAGGLAKFTLMDGAATEYRVGKRVLNATGVTWTGFELYFGTGSWANPASTALYQFDHDQPLIFVGPATGAFTETKSAHLIQWGGLAVAPGEWISIEFAVDIGAGATGEWWIEQQPIGAPEPASGALALLVLAAGWLKRRAG